MLLASARCHVATAALRSPALSGCRPTRQTALARQPASADPVGVTTSDKKRSKHQQRRVSPQVGGNVYFVAAGPAFPTLVVSVERSVPKVVADR